MRKEIIKLNDAQKEVILDNMFEKWDYYKIFGCSKEEAAKLDMSVGSPDAYGWRPLYVNGTKVTSLNFDVYSHVWDEVVELGQ